jgi:hypothetical protein
MSENPEIKEDFKNGRRVHFAERYDPNSPVCQNQDDFNVAFKNAIKYNSDQNMKKAKPWLIVYAVLWAVFLVWGIVLAMQITSPVERVEHLLFAIIFSPAYVLAYYLGALSKPGSSGIPMGMRHSRMGMCGMRPQ